MSNSSAPPIEAPHKLSPAQLKASDVFAYWSPKCRRSIFCVGPDAYRLGVWLESQPDVLVYSERPWGKNTATRIADFVAVHADNTRVVHSVERRKLSQHDALLASIEAWIRTKNDKPSWFDEKSSSDIKREVEFALQALPYVSQHRKRGSRELELKLLALTASGATTIGDLERSFGGAGIEVRSALFALVFEGKLQVDFSGQADLDSRISKKR